MTTNKWTPEEEAKLRELWATDLMPLEISRRMGMTKNQVLGKAYRLILPPKKQRRSDAPPPPRKRVAEAERKRETYVVEPLLVRTCQYPHGDPRKPGFHFCGSLVVPGKPYCEAHCAVTYTRYANGKEAQRALERQLGGMLKAIEREAREMKV